MRDTPRNIPLRLKLEVLFSGIYFTVGVTFMISAVLFLVIFGWESTTDTLKVTAIIFLLWGLGLIIHSVQTNWRKVNRLIWGKIYFGRLLERKKSFSDPLGNVYYECSFDYEYRQKNHQPVLYIRNAYDLEDHRYYILLIDEENPEKPGCIHEYSERIIRYIHQYYGDAIIQAKRNQQLD